MSQRRAKRLRRQFLEEHGRAPRKAVWSRGEIHPSEPNDPPDTYRITPGAVAARNEFRRYAKERRG